MIPGGYCGTSLSSSTSLSHLSFFFLDFLPFVDVAGGGCELQTVHSGTRCLIISVSISAPGTRRRHWRQLAIANDPWHCSTRFTPANVSRVSMF